MQNVYFELTPDGLSQRCYCRCDTTEGRKFGLCSQYRGPVWTVPDATLRKFFPPEPTANCIDVQPMPSQQAADNETMDAIFKRSRMAYSKAPQKKSRKNMSKTNKNGGR